MSPNPKKGNKVLVANAADAALAQISHCLLVGIDVPVLRSGVRRARSLNPKP